MGPITVPFLLTAYKRHRHVGPVRSGDECRSLPVRPGNGGGTTIWGAAPTPRRGHDMIKAAPTQPGCAAFDSARERSVRNASDGTRNHPEVMT